MYLKKIGDYRYHIAHSIDAGSPKYVGEVRSRDQGRSWKFRVVLENKYALEGPCAGLDAGIESIMRTLWGSWYI
jgi:hypothetical protein